LATLGLCLLFNNNNNNNNKKASYYDHERNAIVPRGGGAAVTTVCGWDVLTNEQVNAVSVAGTTLFCGWAGQFFL
jgi:hypothetical protein